MIRYKPPSRRKIAQQLARAGADVNQQIGGSLWISSNLQGVGIAKLGADDLGHLREARNMLDKALGELAAMGAPFASKLPHNFPMNLQESEQPLGWLNPDVIEPIARAAWHLDFCIDTYRPGKSSAHHQFWKELNRYFEVEGIKATFSSSSPIVMIFAECTGLTPESAYHAAKKFRKVQK
ncbi:TPA: hypothetical protein ACOEBN_000597 [Stenotrophomonas maltophilia]|uniref:Uncharacterized protein n=1 Tax=Stenotrophomonas riyadhensis TaxID=2859893 RepID=A0ABT2XCA5_9GAMM|nr:MULTISPECIES: hypothetical protein [Stenotrophomonas]EKT4075428.1 hypothetical protein [Stenotrophomonas maltophilia]MBH1563538.1 hypothetical protein [Stenotrophomonas maltophilia]MBH1597017.1 hypothetical protein [Stenotrophomonas maltophilia]MBH1643947.1 hypothetical protein [Stenotrophomonas maltophilia]MBH1697555.1 hypothetical protein [Stenotrophomonas maltophilia]